MNDLKDMLVKMLHNTLLAIGIVAVMAAPSVAFGLYVGCGAAQKAEQVAVDVVVDCGLPAVVAVLADLVDAAKDALLGADPQKDIDAIVARSKQAGYCAILVAVNDMATPSSLPAERIGASADAWRARGRAEMYLASRHVTLVHVMTVDDYRAVRAARRAR